LPEPSSAEPEINLPDVVAEVTAAFMRYEEALNTNDVAVLNELFRDAPYTLRFGLAEELYGHDQIAAFRGARIPPGSDQQYGDHHIRPRFRDRLDRIPPSRTGAQRPPAAKLGALSRRLADCRGACHLLGCGRQKIKISRRN